MTELTRRQREIFDFLRDNYERFAYPPTLDELCAALGMASRGSLYKHIMALIGAGLVEPFTGNKQGGIRLTAQAQRDDVACEHALPFVGKIAAGKPIEALENISYMAVPEVLKSDKPCYVLQVQGDSMIEAGIFDGDWVIIEQRSYASNGEIVRSADREGGSDPEIHRAVAGERVIDPGQCQHDGDGIPSRAGRNPGRVGRTNAQLPFTLGHKHLNEESYHAKKNSHAGSSQ